MFYKVVFWLMVAVMALGLIAFGFLALMACGMSDAPHTCSLPFVGYIN